MQNRFLPLPKSLLLCESVLQQSGEQLFFTFIEVCKGGLSHTMERKLQPWHFISKGPQSAITNYFTLNVLLNPIDMFFFPNEP